MSCSTTTRPPHARPSWLRACLLAVALLALLPGARAQAAGLAPPASAASQSACAAQVASDAKTADIAQRVSAPLVLGGCVTDGGTGIAHVLLTWRAGDGGRHGRICTDPSIAADGAWACRWDNADLPRGSYTVRFTAVDEAGNAGHFDRSYELVAPPAQADVAPPAAAIDPASEPVAGGGPAATATPPAPATAPTDVPATGADVAPASGSQPADDAAADAPQAAATAGADGATATGVDTTAGNPSPDVVPPGPDLVQQLALARIAACDRGDVADAPTDDPSVVSQVDQADAVRACLAPALLSLGATDVALDAVPVPPAVRITFAHGDELRALGAVLPSDVAGVPIEYVAADAPPPDPPAAAATP